MYNFDKQLEQILIHRKPEFWLNNIFMNLTEYYHDDYPDIIFYKNVNDIVFEFDLKTECFYYHYSKIYFILRDKYHCNDNEIKELIKGQVEKHLKLCVKITTLGGGNKMQWIEEHIKLGVKTTNIFIIQNNLKLIEYLKLRIKTTTIDYKLYCI